MFRWSIFRAFAAITAAPAIRHTSVLICLKAALKIVMWFSFSIKLAGEVGFEPTHARSKVASLTAWRLPNGEPEWTRTTDLNLRRVALYPSELQVRVWNKFQ